MGARIDELVRRPMKHAGGDPRMEAHADEERAGLAAHSNTMRVGSSGEQPLSIPDDIHASVREDKALPAGRRSRRYRDPTTGGETAKGRRRIQFHVTASPGAADLLR